MIIINEKDNLLYKWNSGNWFSDSKYTSIDFYLVDQKLSNTNM